MALVVCAVAADSAGQYFTALGDVLLQSARIFEIDVFDSIGAEIAGFTSSGWSIMSTRHFSILLSVLD